MSENLRGGFFWLTLYTTCTMGSAIGCAKWAMAHRIFECLMCAYYCHALPETCLYWQQIVLIDNIDVLSLLKWTIRVAKCTVLYYQQMTPGVLFMKGRKPKSHVRPSHIGFAMSHVIHETNRWCDSRRFGRKLCHNLRRAFRSRKCIFTITTVIFISFNSVMWHFTVNYVSFSTYSFAYSYVWKICVVLIMGTSNTVITKLRTVKSSLRDSHDK